jgi:hypothetical protein
MDFLEVNELHHGVIRTLSCIQKVADLIVWQWNDVFHGFLHFRQIHAETTFRIRRVSPRPLHVVIRMQ